jgi:hypothetical protein
VPDRVGVRLRVGEAPGVLESVRDGVRETVGVWEAVGVRVRDEVALGV